MYKAFLTAFVDFVKGLQIGGFENAGAALGPVQNSMQYSKLLDLYSDIRKKE
jgi:hypothetical protein